MPEVCTDDRFEMIERVKQRLMQKTNIETCQAEMQVIDDILFRFWQLGWLQLIDEGSEDMRYCIDYVNPRHPFYDDGTLNIRHCRELQESVAESLLVLMLSCGCKIVDLYRGNVRQGRLGEWKTPLIVDKEDWITEAWINALRTVNK